MIFFMPIVLQIEIKRLILGVITIIHGKSFPKSILSTPFVPLKSLQIWQNFLFYQKPPFLDFGC